MTASRPHAKPGKHRHKRAFAGSPCLALCSILLFSACNSGLDGTWDAPSGDVSYEFHADGEVRIHALGSEVRGQYTQEGDRIVLTSPQGTVVLHRDGDRLEGPMGAEFQRRSAKQ